MLRAVAAALLAAAVVAPLGASVATAPAAAAWPTPNVTITGHGWGHGRGMGQWGAYGYATNGVSYPWILDNFYGGTSDGTNVTSQPVTVRLMAQEGSELYVTTPSGGMSVGGVSVPAPGAARVFFSGGQFFVATSSQCGQPFGAPIAIADPTVTPNVADPGGNYSVMLKLCAGTSYRGQLRLAYDGTMHTVNVVPMEWYLYGVVPRESPASWANATGGINALRAQAIAARSYAWAENRYSYARTCDTTSCQVYGGAAFGSYTGNTPLEDPRTTQAVNDTVAHVRKFSDGSIARTEFSSSTGGYTAGGTFPAVPDDGDTVSPYHNWSVNVPAANIAADYGVGTLTDITVLTRNGLGADGGRVLSIKITGTAGSVTTTGNGFAATLGLRSNWFTIANPPPPPATAELWQLRYTPSSGNPDVTFYYGVPGDKLLVCDWFGIGRATPGVKRGSQWYLSKSPTGATVDASFSFGLSTDTPLCGDWDGNGTETPALWRNGTFILSNTLGAGSFSVAYGGSTDIPVAGRWGGGPYDLIGYVHNGQWHLSGGNLAPADMRVFYYGVAGDTPLVGDWNGDGIDTAGIRRGSVFQLSDDDFSVRYGFYYGIDSDTPFAGRFVPGSAVTGIGVGRAV